MDGFLLSPGITPTITDVFVVELPILLGLAYACFGRRGVVAGFALNGLALGLVKVYTDWSDLLDLVVALAVLAASVAILLPLEGPKSTARARSVAVRSLGGVAVLLGLLKIALDFFDPFDVLLADVGVVAGLWLLLRTPRGTAPGAAGAPASPSG